MLTTRLVSFQQCNHACVNCLPLRGLYSLAGYFHNLIFRASKSEKWISLNHLKVCVDIKNKDKGSYLVKRALYTKTTLPLSLGPPTRRMSMSHIAWLESIQQHNRVVHPWKVPKRLKTTVVNDDMLTLHSYSSLVSPLQLSFPVAIARELLDWIWFEQLWNPCQSKSMPPKLCKSILLPMLSQICRYIRLVQSSCQLETVLKLALLTIE